MCVCKYRHAHTLHTLQTVVTYMHAYVHTYITACMHICVSICMCELMYMYVIDTCVCLANIYIYIHMIHYITLPYLTLPYLTLHYITLHYITLHYITLHYITLHYITLHYITLHYITLHYITLHYITLHYITLHYITFMSVSHTFIHTCVHVHTYMYIHMYILTHTHPYTLGLMISECRGLFAGLHQLGPGSGAPRAFWERRDARQGMPRTGTEPPQHGLG